MKQVYPLVMLVLLSLGVGCATSAPTTAPIKGTISSGVYLSPLKNFSVTIPNGLGLQIEDNNSNEGGRVSFHDDFGTLSAITYLRLPANADEVLGDNARRDAAYSGFLKDFAIPELFSRVSQDIRIVHEEFLGEGEDRAYFAVVSLPEGSTLRDLKQNKRLDSVRKILIFAKRGFMYMIEGEMNTVIRKVDPSSLTPKQLESAESTLEHVEDSIVFK